MPDPTTELKRYVAELREISKALDAVVTPELVRPDVPYKQLNEKLINWAIRVYAYSILCQFRELLRTVLDLYDVGHVPAIFLCARAMWEIAAHAYYVKKHCLQYMEQGLQETWDFLTKINQGSRYMNEKMKAVGLEPLEGPHIAKVMACFDEYFPGEKKRATTNYSFLSEFSHPNSFAFTNHIDMEKATKEDASAKVVFLKPDREVTIQVMPDIHYCCMPLLLSMNELLDKIGDDGFRQAAEEFARMVRPVEPGVVSGSAN